MFIYKPIAYSAREKEKKKWQCELNTFGLMELNLFRMSDQKQKLFPMEQLNFRYGALMDQAQTKLQETTLIVYSDQFSLAQTQFVEAETSLCSVTYVYPMAI